MTTAEEKEKCYKLHLTVDDKVILDDYYVSKKVDLDELEKIILQMVVLANMDAQKGGKLLRRLRSKAMQDRKLSAMFKHK